MRCDGSRSGWSVWSLLRLARLSTRSSTTTMTDYCAACGHPDLFHGDRAIAACDGGYGLNAQGFLHMPGGNWYRRVGEYGPGPECGCPGWT